MGDQMDISDYIAKIKKEIELGKSTEHSFRGYLQSFLSDFITGFDVTNEPKRQHCGAPDYIITREGIPVGFIETKDVGLDLNKVEKSDQLVRYLSSLDNLILTDYLEFRFYRSGLPVGSARIGSIEKGKVKTMQQEVSRFEALLNEFFNYQGQTIKSPDALARMMADKAKLMEEITINALDSGESVDEGLEGQYEAFKSILIHDLNHRQFADIYAQTIAYGLFAARLNDQTLNTFNRQEAGYLVPKTNPFLFQLFSYIAGPTLDERIAWVVDALAEVFRACDVAALLADFGKETMSTDPFIHFYETFLTEYDPKLRKSRGVYYTPEPVVSFIVRSVDKLLERDFSLPMGLADTSMTDVMVDGFEKAKQKTPNKVKTQVHRVQILDPAAGTGTFLVEVLKQIYSRYEGQQGLWQDYVEESLLPRVHGFEILMAPYAMCHLKLGMFLKQTGYQPKNSTRPRRLGVYLTNSLEEAHPDTGSLFAQWLTQEAMAANLVKRNAPVMVVLGNPPYANHGMQNKGDWIKKLLDVYKEGLDETKLNLDDDYIKFIRYSEQYIEKTGHGIVAMITNNSYIDGITHRKMREHLMATFDDIYIFDLHGSTKKKETTPDGGKDENVFDIQQGVSIVLMIRKKTSKKKAATIRHAELYGRRDEKYHTLFRNDVLTQEWKVIKPEAPYFFFTNQQYSSPTKDEFTIDELFPINVNGFETHNDDIVIHFNEKSCKNVINDFLLMSEIDIAEKYAINHEGRDWKIATAKKNVGAKDGSIIPITYRPFDKRYTYYSNKSKGFMAYPRYDVLKNLLRPNIALLAKRQCKRDFSYSFLVNQVCEACVFESAYAKNQVFPLYLYSDSSEMDGSIRRPNLNMNIVNDLAKRLKLKFIVDHEYSSAQYMDGLNLKEVFTPLDLLDYIYAVLHSPSYRNKNKELLKIGFPRIPYPVNADIFFALAKKGASLRSFHLLENPELNKPITKYPYVGSNIVESIKWEGLDEEGADIIGNVRINAKQCFEDVPRKTWDFWIGGYQPARRWLKDRKGLTLNADEIMHWQKIVIALLETSVIMDEIERLWKA